MLHLDIRTKDYKWPSVFVISRRMLTAFVMCCSLIWAYFYGLIPGTWLKERREAVDSLELPEHTERIVFSFPGKHNAACGYVAYTNVYGTQLTKFVGRKGKDDSVWVRDISFNYETTRKDLVRKLNERSFISGVQESRREEIREILSQNKEFDVIWRGLCQVSRAPD